MEVIIKLDGLADEYAKYEQLIDHMTPREVETFRGILSNSNIDTGVINAIDYVIDTESLLPLGTIDEYVFDIMNELRNNVMYESFLILYTSKKKILIVTDIA